MSSVAPVPSVETRRHQRRHHCAKLGFAPAVRLGAMVEAPLGEPEMPPLIEAIGALGRELFCIVEQDLYPCAPDVPFPIAKRTQEYFVALGLAAA